MNGRNPYDAGTKIRELRWQQEHLADFINRHMDEFDGFYDIEEDFVFAISPEIKRDIEDDP